MSKNKHLIIIFTIFFLLLILISIAIFLVVRCSSRKNTNTKKAIYEKSIRLNPGQNKNNVIVKLKDNIKLSDYKNKYKMSGYTQSLLKTFNGNYTDKQINELIRDPKVEYIEVNGKSELFTTSQQTSGTPGLWGLDYVDNRIDGRFSFNETGKGVDIYIVDSGTIPNHSDFRGSNGRTRVLPGFSDLDNSRGLSDGLNHGTPVASNAGGRTCGIAKDCNLIPVKVMAKSGGFSWNTLRGLEWVFNQIRNQNKISVVNYSMGAPGKAVEQAIRRLINTNKIIFVNAAGNDNNLYNNREYNACPVRINQPREDLTRANSIEKTVTVGANDRSLRRSTFSNFGSCVNLSAPGSRVRVAVNTGGFIDFNGTSMSAPFVSGVIAALIEKYPNIKDAEWFRKKIIQLSQKWKFKIKFIWRPKSYKKRSK